MKLQFVYNLAFRTLAFAFFYLVLIFSTTNADTVDNAQSSSKIEADERVTRQLDKMENVEGYTVLPFGIVYIKFTLSDGRKQGVFIGHRTGWYHGHEIRNVWSPALKFKEDLPRELSLDLLEQSHNMKWGGWANNGYTIRFVVQISANADKKSLWAAMLHSVNVADELEEKHTQKDVF